MSSAASWSYTAKATHWSLTGRDDWTGANTFGAPVVFDCDYSAESARMVDAKGVEFVSRQIIYTERSSIAAGDWVLIGESTEVNPVHAGATEVRLVVRFADTLDRVADDYKVVT